MALRSTIRFTTLRGNFLPIAAAGSLEPALSLNHGGWRGDGPSARRVSPSQSSLKLCYTDTMSLPVSLRDVVDELDALSQGMIAYCNRKTGEVASLTQEMLAAAEEESDFSDFDDDMLAELRDIVNSEDWVALPDSFEIHEWEILRDFTDSVEDGRLREELQRAIHGRGAFRHFKETVRRNGIEDSWYDFKRSALEKIVRKALDAAGIPYAG